MVILNILSFGSYYFIIQQQHFEYDVLFDEDEVNEVNSISAIAFHDKRNLPSDGTPFCVGTSEVTNGVTHPNSGFSKMSSWTLLTRFHEVFLVITALIRKEDARTFEFEIQLLLNDYPFLRYDKIVLLLDCD
jgi:hypothetical protein